jgi:perosamine synthetase
MDPKRFEALLVGPDATIRDVIEAIEAGAIEIALVVDERRRLIGTVSDGDVRRALLTGTSLDAGIESVVHREPTTAPEAAKKDDLLRLMTERGIQQIPLLRGGEVRDVAFMRDLLTRVPLSVPTLGDREALYLQQCIEERWVAGKGRFVREFEALFAEMHGVQDAVSVASGTAALHLALLEAGVRPGDEVVVPALTFVASANPVLYAGATPVFADVDPGTFTLDPAAFDAAITDRTTAVVVVHLFGHPADMDPIIAIARRHDIVVIEDATEALGSTYKGRLCGTLGEFAAFSFNGNKVITSGGGGMVLARDPERVGHIRHVSLQARVPGTFEYRHDELGFNYGLSNLQAAVGLAQLETIEERLAARRVIFTRYSEALDGRPGLRFTREEPWARSNCWLMSVLIDPETHDRDRDRVMRDLDAVGIEARPFFAPLRRHDHLRGFQGQAPVADRVHSRGLNIPSSADLDADAQGRVIAALLRS